MKYVHFSGNNGYCGTDYDEYVMFDDDCPEDEIENYSAELAYQCAESYEYLETGWYMMILRMKMTVKHIMKML